METKENLKIAIVGVGGIGSAFAFQLARIGRHDVTVVARPGSKRLSELQRDQGILNDKGEKADVRIAHALDPLATYDLIIVTLKAYQLAPLIPVLKRSSAKLIQFMFNIFDPDRLKGEIGLDRCTFGMPFIQSFIDGEGILHATIGANGQKTLLERKAVVDLFTSSGLPARPEPNMLLWLRSHAPLCVAFEGVSYLGVRRGGGCSWKEAETMARGIKESFVLIEELGFSVYPTGKVTLKRSPAFVTAGILWSMSRVRPFRELLATGVEECRELVDSMVAASHNVPSQVKVSRIQQMKPSVESS